MGSDEGIPGWGGPCSPGSGRVWPRKSNVLVPSLPRPPAAFPERGYYRPGVDCRSLYLGRPTRHGGPGSPPRARVSPSGPCLPPWPCCYPRYRSSYRFRIHPLLPVSRYGVTLLQIPIFSVSLSYLLCSKSLSPGDTAPSSPAPPQSGGQGAHRRTTAGFAGVSFSGTKLWLHARLPRPSLAFVVLPLCPSALFSGRLSSQPSGCARSLST